MKWTVILNFNRESEVYKDLSTQEARKMIDIAVFKNRDSVSFYCFLQKED